jgi:serine/threonine-protein kinase
MFEAPPRPTMKGASLGALESVILRALEKNPDHRYQSMGELLVDLDTVAAGGTVQAPPRAAVAPPPGNLAGALDPAAPIEASPARATTRSGGGGILIAGLAVAALAVVGVGVAFAVFMLTGDDGALAHAEPPPQPAPAAAAPAEPVAAPAPAVATPAPAVAPAPTPTPVVAAAVAPVAPAPTPAPAQPVQVAIQSEPPGAEVLLDGVMVGNTPVTVPRPATGTQAVTLRLRDHEETTIQISPQSGSSLSVTLARARQAARTTAPRRPLPTPIVTPIAPTPPPVPISRPAAPPPRRSSSTNEVVDPWGE